MSERAIRFIMLKHGDRYLPPLQLVLTDEERATIPTDLLPIFERPVATWKGRQRKRACAWLVAQRERS